MVVTTVEGLETKTSKDNACRSQVPMWAEYRYGHQIEMWEMQSRIPLAEACVYPVSYLSCGDDPSCIMIIIRRLRTLVLPQFVPKSETDVALKKRKRCSHSHLVSSDAESDAWAGSIFR